MSFDWIDYPGGSLDKKNKGNLEEYEDIKNTINKSSSLFICVDGSLLCGDDFEEKVDNVKDNCSNVINTFVKDYKQENKVLPPTAIIVTKYDLCMADTDAEQLKDIIKGGSNMKKKMVSVLLTASMLAGMTMFAVPVMAEDAAPENEVTGDASADDSFVVWGWNDDIKKILDGPFKEAYPDDYERIVFVNTGGSDYYQGKLDPVLDDPSNELYPDMMGPVSYTHLGPWKRMSCRYGSLWFAV